MMVKISIIVPVYNMDKYIAETLESIEKQTMAEKEIICVDDGSTDHSYDIAVRFSEMYSNITVYRQVNSGPGKARNLGISHATGEFVCFMDADDFYASEDALEYLYHLAKKENVDVCGGSSCDYKDKRLNIIGLRAERRFSADQYIKREDYPGMTGYTAFIYKRKFLINNEIFFPNYLREQDPPFFVKAIAYGGGAYCSKKLIYVYRKGHKKVKYNIQNALDIASGLRDVFEVSAKYNMKNVYQQVINELNGELGALIYKFSNEGSERMLELVREFNNLTNSELTVKDILENGKVLLEGEEINQYVSENIKIKNQFIEMLQKKNQVFIFGAGMIGTKIALFLKENQINIDAFIVSDRSQNAAMIEGISVKSVEEIKDELDDYIIIIATYWYSQNEIINMLRAKKIDKIYPANLRRFFLWQDEIEH